MLEKISKLWKPSIDEIYAKNINLQKACEFLYEHFLLNISDDVTVGDDVFYYTHDDRKYHFATHNVVTDQFTIYYPNGDSFTMKWLEFRTYYRFYRKKRESVTYFSDEQLSKASNLWKTNISGERSYKIYNPYNTEYRYNNKGQPGDLIAYRDRKTGLLTLYLKDDEKMILGFDEFTRYRMTGQKEAPINNTNNSGKYFILVGSICLIGLGIWYII